VTAFKGFPGPSENAFFMTLYINFYKGYVIEAIAIEGPKLHLIAARNRFVRHGISTEASKTSAVVAFVKGHSHYPRAAATRERNALNPSSTPKQCP